MPRSLPILLSCSLVVSLTLTASARADFVGPLWLVTAVYPHAEVPKPQATPSMAKPVFRSDAFTRMVERNIGMAPGTMKTMPECGCTIRYNGTRINGGHYDVSIDKLD